jgi:hypothetical protein
MLSVAAFGGYAFVSLVFAQWSRLAWWAAALLALVVLAALHSFF